MGTKKYGRRKTARRAYEGMYGKARRRKQMERSSRRIDRWIGPLTGGRYEGSTTIGKPRRKGWGPIFRNLFRMFD